MLYYLFEILESQFNFPGASLFGYLSFRASVSVLISLIVSVVFGKKIINYLKRKQIGENIRVLGLEGEDKKSRNSYYGWFNNYNRNTHSCNSNV
jgi:phospho-N-acetylmuramoyl-pentapeptide-transferase